MWAALLDDLSQDDASSGAFFLRAASRRQTQTPRPRSALSQRLMPGLADTGDRGQHLETERDGTLRQFLLRRKRYFSFFFSLKIVIDKEVHPGFFH